MTQVLLPPALAARFQHAPEKQTALDKLLFPVGKSVAALSCAALALIVAPVGPSH